MVQPGKRVLSKNQRLILKLMAFARHALSLIEECRRREGRAWAGLRKQGCRLYNVEVYPKCMLLMHSMHSEHGMH